MGFQGTTICAVKRDGKVAIAGDGQVTMGEHTIFKSTAKKVRRIYNDQVVIGFAGSVADAFTLSDRFEEKLMQSGGNLERGRRQPGPGMAGRQGAAPAAGPAYCRQRKPDADDLRHRRGD